MNDQINTTELPNAELGRLHRENALLSDVLNRAVVLLNSIPADAQNCAIRDVLAQAKSLGIPPTQTKDLFRLQQAEASIAYADQRRGAAQ